MKDVLRVLDQKGNCADGHKATQMAVVTMILFNVIIDRLYSSFGYQIWSCYYSSIVVVFFLLS